MRLIPGSLVEKLRMRLGVPSQKWSLINLKKSGFNPTKIVDIGAYEGKWTEEVSEVFPKAQFLMIEAQSEKEPLIKNVALKDSSRRDYRIELLSSDDNKMLLFNQYESASSVLVEHHDTGAKKKTITSKSLDTVLNDSNFQTPDFIKLDTQGYELEILKGGNSALTFAKVVLMEVSFIDIYKNGPLVLDVLNFMDKHNFQTYDICSILRRPLDKALFQSDLLFIKKDSPLIQSKKWC